MEDGYGAGRPEKDSKEYFISKVKDIDPQLDHLNIDPLVRKSTLFGSNRCFFLM